MAAAYDVDSNRLHFLELGRESVAASYRMLPRVVVASLCWCLLAVTLVFLAPATATLFVVADSVLNGGNIETRTVASAFRRFFWRSQVAFVPFIVLLDLAWALWLQGGVTGELGIGIGAFLVLDVLVVYSYLMLYYFPLLIDHDSPALDTAHRSATMAVSSGRASIGLFLFVASTMVLLAFTVAGFALVGPGVLATTVLLATRYLVTDGGVA